MKFNLGARLGAIALAGALALSGFTATAAQAAVNRSTASPGNTVVVTGSNVCKTSLIVAGKAVQPRSNGYWSLRVTAPWKAGTYTITGVCDNYGSKKKFTAGKYTVLPTLVSSISAGSKGTATIRIKHNVSTKSLAVKVYDGRKYLKTITVKPGQNRSNTLKGLKKGNHTIKVVYGKASQTLKVRVK